MNYPANTVTWPIGSLVLHDCDAKRADMLMRVVKYLPSGKVRAEYIDGERRERMLYRAGKRPRDDNSGWFDLCDLHDPKRFGVELPSAPDAQQGEKAGK